MAKWLKSEPSNLLKKIAFVLLAFSLIRIVFLFTNLHFFSGLSHRQILGALIYSIKFDLAIIAPLNSIFLLLVIVFPFRFERNRSLMTNLFVLTNGLLLFVSICDNVYFSYTRHRINYSLIYLVPQSFTVKLLATYVTAGWYWILLLAALFFTYRKMFRYGQKKPVSAKYSWQTKVLLSSIILATSFAAVRGFESRPLSPSTVLLYYPPKLINLASNTAFNVLYSFYKGQKELNEKTYFTPEELDKLFPIYHVATGKKQSFNPNVVLFVMESFARDFLDRSSRFKAATPFLDSLMQQSIVFRNAFSNGNESTHGLVAILASLPPFMQIPYYHSQYHANSIHGLGNLLTENQYDCSFFLGDVYDSFGFTEFTHSVGINHYYSRKDFGDDKYYNGAWGIHDDKFFAYAADVLSLKKQPFFAGIFNVSSHPPYIIPDDLKKRFEIPGQNAAQNSVSYVDFAYRQFFEKARRQKWFNNTVFLFVADHFLSPSDDKEVNSVNMNEIPFFIYSPGIPGLKADSAQLVDQLDVLPTVLDITGYRGRYMSFGKSVFDAPGKRYAVQRMDYVYQIMDSSYALGFNINTDDVIYLYNYNADPGLKKNLDQDPLMKTKRTELENHLKAMIQRYNHAFLNNLLWF